MKKKGGCNDDGIASERRKREWIHERDMHTNVVLYWCSLNVHGTAGSIMQQEKGVERNEPLLWTQDWKGKNNGRMDGAGSTQSMHTRRKKADGHGSHGQTEQWAPGAGASRMLVVTHCTKSDGHGCTCRTGPDRYFT